MSSTDRTEAALAYLAAVVDGTEQPDSTRVAAARAIIAKDGRDAAAANGSGSGWRGRATVYFDAADGDEDA